MKANKKLIFLILIIATISLLAGTIFCGAASENPDKIIQQRLDKTVVVYSGSMYSLADNNLKVIDPENELITPFIQNDRLLVPIRFISEAFGATVSWNQSEQTATITAKDKTVKIKIYSDKMTVDGKEVLLDVPAMVTGDRTFIPLRALGEALGKEIFYDRGLVIISDKADLFSVSKDKELIDNIIARVNILPTVGTKENFVKLLSNAVRGGNKYIAFDRQAKSTAENTSNSGDGMGGGDSYSKTNIQVEGVDEADIVKTDGKYIYQVSNQNIKIYIAYPASEMKLASSIPFKNDQFTPEELYIYKDKLIVIGISYLNNATDTSKSGCPEYNNILTKALIYDVSDRGNPKNIREVSLQGYYLTSRLIGDDLYLISNQNIYYLGENPEPLNPQYKDSASGSEIISVPFENVKYIPPVVNRSYLMIAGLSLDDIDKPVNMETYLGAGNDVYVSQDNLYITINEGYYGIRPMLKTADGFIPSPVEESTLIHKFSLKDAKVTYQAKGQVPGRILNQFSMDENKGKFRIATTVGYSWGQRDNTSKNNVYVLDENLNIMGKLENLAQGEQIYSVRFMGNRGYMVTFKNVDPLFVLNLENPKEPKVLGELKIPGYSDYLHPYDETHLIGFGKDTINLPIKDNNGKVVDTGTYYLGMKVSLFDVSDVSNPIEKFNVKIGDRGTDSELLSDHKVLLFDRERQLLAFPVNEAKVSGSFIVPGFNYPAYGETVFSGAYVYNLNLKDGFILKGKITHNDSEKPFLGDERDYNKQIRRMLFIDDILYGVSNNELSAHDIKDLKELGFVSEK